MEDHDKAGSEMYGFVPFEKHAGNDTVNGMEEAVKEGPVKKEKLPELFIHGKNTVAVMDINEFKGQRGRAFHGIFIVAGRTEPAVASERDKFEIAAVRAGKHGAAKGRIAAVDHFIDIIHFCSSGMEGIFNFFIMV